MPIKPRYTLPNRATIFSLGLIGIVTGMLSGPVHAVAPPVVIFDTDFALPAMPTGDGTGTPVCIGLPSGLLVAGCDAAVGPEVLQSILDAVEGNRKLLEPKTIFVTSVDFSGDLVTAANSLLGASFSESEGLVAADAICQSLADAPGSIVPEGEYVALLSDFVDGISGSSRITQSSGPYITPRGLPITANWAALFDTKPNNTESDLINQVNIDETGGVRNDIPIWTGTTRKGGVAQDCDGWSTSSSGIRGLIGNTIYSTWEWLQITVAGQSDENFCDLMHPMYCVKR